MARDIRPGKKYYDWEIKGVPLRLELGPRDIENDSVFAVRRTGGKTALDRGDIVTLVKQQLAEVEIELKRRADEHLQGRIRQLPELKRKDGRLTISSNIEEGMVYEIPFAAEDAQAEAIEVLTGLTFLGDAIEEYPEALACVVSGQLTRRRVWLAKTY